MSLAFTVITMVISVKLNNPLMGTEEIVCIDTHRSDARHSLN